MKRFIILALFLVSLMLSSCLSALPRLKDEEISNMNGAQLCAVQKMHKADARIDEAIKNKSVDCDPASLYCKAQGKNKGSKKFSTCVANWRSEYKRLEKIQQKRIANPAWADCSDSGFKTGTQAMATCMASWEQRQQQQQMLAVQQRQYEKSQRAQAWRDLGNQLLLQEQIRQQRINSMPMPQHTNCDMWKGTMSCTTW